MYMYMHVCCMDPKHTEGESERLDSLELEFYMVMNHHMGTSNWMWVPARSHPKPHVTEYAKHEAYLLG